jgi:arginine deiminase
MTNPSANYGVHSAVGKLRKVLVCSPGLAHERLTPSNSSTRWSRSPTATW